MNKIDITRFSQPQGPVQIDWANPITRSLVYAVNAASQIEAFTSAPVTFPTTDGVVKRTFNNVVSFQRTSNPQWGFTLNPLKTSSVGNSSDATLIYIGGLKRTTNTVYELISSGHLATSTQFAIRSGTGTSTAIHGFIYSGGITFGGSFSISDDNIHAIALQHKYGVGQTLWVDRQKDPNTGSFTGVFGGPLWFTGIPDGCEYLKPVLLLKFDRCLSDSEIHSISQNPWQIFKPIQKQIFVPQPIAQEPYKVGDALTMANYRKAMQKVWASQPQQESGIDWSNPITRGISAAFNYSGFDNVGGLNLSRSGTLSVSPTSAGLSSGSSGTAYFSLATRNIVAPTNTAFSVVGTFRVNNAAQTNKYIAFLRDSGGTGNQAAVIFGYIANKIEFFAPQFTGSDPRIGSQITIADTKPHTFAYCYDGANWSGYIDGVQVFSVPRTFSCNVSSTNLIGTLLSANGSNTLDGSIVQWSTFSRGLLPSEARLITANPWQIFKPLQNKAPITLPQYTVVTPELLADLIINMTTQSAAASGIPAAISYDQLINMLAANALAQNPGLRLDTQINTLVAQAQASGIQLNLIASAVLSMSTASALATGIRTNLDTLINIQQGNAVASGGNILLDRAIQTVLSSATALGINSNIDKTININRANAQANGVTALIDVVTNLVSGNATANSYGFGSGTVLNLQSITSLASGISTKLDKSINQNAANSLASGVKLSLDQTINTLIANAQASGIKINIDKSILTNTANAISTGIQIILEYAASVVMNAGPASAIGTTLNIDRNILLAAGIANAANVNMSVVFTPLTYDPAYVIFETTEGLVVLDVNKVEVSLVGTSTLLIATAESRSIDLNVEKSTISSEGTQTLVSVSSESRTKIFDSNARPNTFDRN